MDGLARIAGRVGALLVGIIGVVDAIIINTIVATFHDLQRLLGGSVDSHGWLGLGFALLGLVGAILAWWRPWAGAVLLLIAGVGFAFAVHWWALLATPQLLAAAALAFSEQTSGTRQGTQQGARREAAL
ncbi:MAG TPA: hypothetical protein VIG30_07425 [Ktedonobacterales bacterium]|jgi:hypothetical protein